MRKKMKRAAALLCAAALMVTGVTGCGTEKTKETKKTKAAFTALLDTKKKVTLEVAGFLGNFEALDQVVNDFNEYYPNVLVNYEQNGANTLADYMKNNTYVDIFMTSGINVEQSAQAEVDVSDYCLNLSEKNIDTSAIDPELIQACTVNKKLVRIPLFKTMCGMVVNKTLLKKEGIEIPQNYQELLAACKKLKEKGYTPIQSSKYHASSDMVLPMAMSILGNSEELTQKVHAKDGSCAESLRTVYERLNEMIENGYVDSKVNETYPDDNYDGAILNFFEGDVPFWIATTESFSGMQKRESKSEKYSADPFDYAFMNVPLGDKGVYDYEEPWNGFSINRNSKNLEYAVEFMRFLVQEKELNKLAELKGMPAVTLQNDDKRFTEALKPENCEGRYIYNGELNGTVTGAVADAANELGNGTLQTTDEAIQMIQKRLTE